MRIDFNRVGIASGCISLGVLYDYRHRAYLYIYLLHIYLLHIETATGRMGL